MGILAMRGKKTRGQVEAEISAAIIKFEKEFMGRGPTETKTYIIDDLVLVRLRGMMTRAEQQLVPAENTSRGRELIKQVRRELLEQGRPLLEAVIPDILGRKTVSLHTDLSTITALPSHGLLGAPQIRDHASPGVGTVMGAVDPHAIHSSREQFFHQSGIVSRFTGQSNHHAHAPAGRRRPE